MLVETPRMRNSASALSGAPDGRFEVTAATGQLDQHRVEMGADLGTDEDRAAVESDPRPAG